MNRKSTQVNRNPGGKADRENLSIRIAAMSARATVAQVVLGILVAALTGASLYQTYVYKQAEERNEEVQRRPTLIFIKSQDHIRLDLVNVGAGAAQVKYISLFDGKEIFEHSELILGGDKYVKYREVSRNILQNLSQAKNDTQISSEKSSTTEQNGTIESDIIPDPNLPQVYTYFSSVLPGMIIPSGQRYYYLTATYPKDFQFSNQARERFETWRWEFGNWRNSGDIKICYCDILANQCQILSHASNKRTDVKICPVANPAVKPTERSASLH